MNIMPLVAFWSKHGDQIMALAAKSGGDGPNIALDLAWSLAPFLQRHFPQLNEQGIMDDALATLQEMFDKSPPAA